MWVHSCFPSQGGCFSQGVLARRQGSNKDSCKLWRRAPSQHGTAGVSRRHSSLSYHVPPSPGQVTGVSPINPAPWWPLIGTPGFPSPPPSSLGTCFSPVHLLLNLCSQHARHCWELVAVTQIYPLNQGSGHPLAWSRVLRTSRLGPQHQAVWWEGGCSCWARHWAWGPVRASVWRGWEAPGGFLGGYLLGWLRMRERWLLLFLPLPVTKTTGPGAFKPSVAGPRDEPYTCMTRVGP